MQKTILVVDDSLFALQRVKSIVADKEYEVVGYARNGEEGIEKYKELKPDFVILDIIMPGIDGLETAQKLLEEDADAKIVMLSSLCDTSIMEEVKALGLKYLLPKPVEEEKLMEILEQF